MRNCDGCRACCKVFPLPVLGKEADQWCRFICSAGCSVHGNGQPEVCREYSCYWLDHEETSEECRPDRIGLVATESGTITVAGRTIPVCVLNQMEPSAYRGPAAAGFVADLLGQGFALLVIYGLDMQILFDREHWLTISPEQIEAAYREEFLRDTKELKRLGAIDR